jgi:hypothetical protein
MEKSKEEETRNSSFSFRKSRRKTKREKAASLSGEVERRGHLKKQRLCHEVRDCKITNFPMFFSSVSVTKGLQNNEFSDVFLERFSSERRVRNPFLVISR